MSKKRVKVLAYGFIGIIIISITALIFTINAKQINLSDLLNLGKAKVKEESLVYIPLSKIEQYYNVKHSEVDNKIGLEVNNEEVLFHLDTNKIYYNGNKAYKDLFIVEGDDVLVPSTFIKSYYNLNYFETHTGYKLAAFEHIPILLYHTVNNTENNTLNTSPDQFEDHVKHLVAEGYTGISPHELHDFYFGDGQLPEKPVFINFDDGYKDNYTDAYPILKKYNMKATIFIIASRIEHEGINTYPNEIPKLTWEDAVAMKDLVTIQNHTWDSHRKIKAENGKDIGQIAAPQMKDDQTYETKEEYIARIKHDLESAQSIIKEKLGYESVILSYPYGEYSQETIQVANELGIDIAVSVAQGNPMHLDSLMKINRIVIDGNISGEQLIKDIANK